MREPVTLEVCISSVDDAIAAEQGGADRLELNVALELGGLTPSPELLRSVKQAVSLPVIVMIRPRGAGFCYSRHEQQLMLRDAERLLEAGAAGVASGVLRDDRRLDISFWRSLAGVAADRQIVFHRACDTVESVEQLLDELIELGTTRLLTSGGQATALSGREQIARLRERAGAALEILPGAGVTAENVVTLLRATGCNQVHGSFASRQYDPAGIVADDTYPATSVDRVAAVRRVLDAM